MREILFRGKRKDTGAWVYGHLHKTDGYGTGYTEHGIQVQDTSTSRPWSVVVIPETVGQYTGLTDKNGKRIFEGDILRPFDNELVVVSWIDYYSTLGLIVYITNTVKKRGKTINSIYSGWALLSDYSLSENEVIGNIHDNPELLEATE